MLDELKKVVTAVRSRRLSLDYDKIPFTFEQVSWKRLANWLVAEVTGRLRTPFVLAFPTLIQVEPTNRCNLRCPMCYTAADPRPRTSMSFEEFTEVIDGVGDYALLLQLWGWGEPFMHADFCRMVRYAKDKGMKIITATNGHFLASDGEIDELIDSGLDVLMFALDGVDAETYEKYRQRGDFDRVVAALRRLAQRKKERGATLPLINLRMVVSRDNEHQVDRIRELGAEIGADLFTLKTLWNINTAADRSELVPEDPDYRRAEYDADGNAIRILNPCRRFWNNPVVYRDGTVVPCYYHTSDHSLGNVFSAGFGRIWFGWQYIKKRVRFLTRRSDGSPCLECALNYADVDRFASHALWYRQSEGESAETPSAA